MAATGRVELFSGSLFESSPPSQTIALVGSTVSSFVARGSKNVSYHLIRRLARLILIGKSLDMTREVVNDCLKDPSRFQDTITFAEIPKTVCASGSKMHTVRVIRSTWLQSGMSVLSSNLAKLVINKLGGNPVTAKAKMEKVGGLQPVFFSLIRNSTKDQLVREVDWIREEYYDQIYAVVSKILSYNCVIWGQEEDQVVSEVGLAENLVNLGTGTIDNITALCEIVREILFKAIPA